MDGKFQPAPDAVLFEFVNRTVDGKIIEETGSDIILTSITTDYTKPRWGRVLYVGDKIDSEINVGEYILVKNGMWTMCCRIPQEDRDRYNLPTKLWKTDEEQIFAVADQPYSEI